MSDEPRHEDPTASEDLTRFQKLARALFRVQKKDVPKHEPKKRDRRETDAT